MGNNWSPSVLLWGSVLSVSHLTRGTRLGCPLSLLLFLLAIEASAIVIRNDYSIHGILRFGIEHKLSLYADDLLLCMSRDEETIAHVLHLLDTFGKVSGYKLNLHKSESLPINLSESTLAVIHLPSKIANSIRTISCCRPGGWRHQSSFCCVLRNVFSKVLLCVAKVTAPERTFSKLSGDVFSESLKTGRRSSTFWRSWVLMLERSHTFTENLLIRCLTPPSSQCSPTAAAAEPLIQFWTVLVVKSTSSCLGHHRAETIRLWSRRRAKPQTNKDQTSSHQKRLLFIYWHFKSTHS